MVNSENKDEGATLWEEKSKNNPNWLEPVFINTKIIKIILSSLESVLLITGFNFRSI
jgi:hypothetical protein